LQLKCIAASGGQSSRNGPSEGAACGAIQIGTYRARSSTVQYKPTSETGPQIGWVAALKCIEARLRYQLSFGSCNIVQDPFPICWNLKLSKVHREDLPPTRPTCPATIPPETTSAWYADMSSSSNERSQLMCVRQSSVAGKVDLRRICGLSGVRCEQVPSSYQSACASDILDASSRLIQLQLHKERSRQ
uniref:DUF3707 domain-containing protein n=1 Tax=Toxocara canis TaxID=6265 RepID=A0A183VD94_TOXCA